MRKTFLIGIIISSLFGCEKVIEIPVEDAEQTLIVEAVLKDYLGKNYILLSKSGTVYEGTNFEKVVDATITVTDQTGEVFSFEHEGEGRYTSPSLQVSPGFLYNLEVNALGRTITSTCQTRSKPLIDSITYLPISGSFGASDLDTVNLISFHSVDNALEQNFYQAKIFRNGKANQGYYWGNDAFINGQYYQAQFFGATARSGDSVLIEVISMDQANYDYLVGLANNINSGPFSAAPANPPSNLVGNALGFFGAYTTDTLGIVIP